MGNNPTISQSRREDSEDNVTSPTNNVVGNRGLTHQPVNSLSNQRNNSSGHSFSFRRTGSLGLSKAELDRRCKPSGLYKSCEWDDRIIRRLIADGKLAARLVGSEHDSSLVPQVSGSNISTYLHECPICFLQYAQVNITNCCSASICTECYLQIRPPKDKNVVCPFCNHNNLSVRVAKELDEKDVMKREEEEQRAIEATIRARAGGGISGCNSADGSCKFDESNRTVCTVDTSSGTVTPGNEFGSHLERRLRARSESLSGKDLCNHGMIMTISPEERLLLEKEMKDQKAHPLVRMLELEAEETRHRHEIEHSERVLRNRIVHRSGILQNEMGARGRSLSEPGRVAGNFGLIRPDRPELSNLTGQSRSERDSNDLRMLETALMMTMEQRVLNQPSSLPSHHLSDRLSNESADDEYGDDRNSHTDALSLLQELLLRRQQLRDRRLAATSSSRMNQRRLAVEAQLEAATNMLLSILPEEDQIAMAMVLSMGETNVSHADPEDVEHTSLVEAAETQESDGPESIVNESIMEEHAEELSPAESTEINQGEGQEREALDCSIDSDVEHYDQTNVVSDGMSAVAETSKSPNTD